MTEGVGSGELNVMTEFDFKTPINATVIYYDSDEDVKPLIENKKKWNDMTKNIDIIVSEIFEDIFKASNKSNDENQVSTTKRKQSSDEKNNKKSKKAEQNRKNENNAELEYENETEILGENHAEERGNKTISRKHQSESSVQGSVLQSTSNSEIVIDVLQNLNNKEIRNPLHTENANRNLKTNTVQEIVENHSLVNINMQIDECLQTLLNTVSTHMIFIMKAYADYKAVTRRISDTKLLEKAKKQYQDSKYHFFYLSFSAVANIMLPKENEYNFVENFIDNTVKMAKSRHFYFKHTDMRSLCTEMFGWVKSHSQHSLLSELLNKPPQQHPHTTMQRNTNSYHERKGCDKTNNVDKTCLFRSGPPNRELVINVNSTLVQNSMQQYNDVNMSLHTVHPSMQPPSNNTNLQSYTNPPSYIIPPSNTNLPKYTNPQSYENPPSYLNLQNNTNLSSYINSPTYGNPPSYENQPSYLNQPSCVNPQSTTNPPGYTNIPGYMQEFQAFHSRQDYNRQLPIHQTKPMKRQADAQSKIPHHNPTSQDRTLRPPPWRNETLIPQDVLSPAHCGGFLLDQCQTEVGQNRSLSRDSGFMSPLSSVPNDPMCNSPRNGQIDSSTLVITHVTSLNPSVAYIKDGTCHVCNKLTKQICLGCYKTYYCSNQCQRDDWRNHFLHCKL